MKVLISVDMEGISGVVSQTHVTSDHRDYVRFRKLMTEETNAAVEGALAGGATDIVINDSHDRMDNILIEELHPSVELISGSPKPLGMMQGIAPDIDAVFLVGYHAASGTPSAVLEHTWSGRLVDVQLNGRSVGEMGLNAALAGAFGAPVLLVTGDLAVCREAHELLGEIETVPVKEGITRKSARCLHPETARERIRQAAERAMGLSIRPFAVTPPIELGIVFMRSMEADMAELVVGCRRLDGRTVAWQGDDMVVVYKTFRAMTALAASG